MDHDGALDAIAFDSWENYDAPDDPWLEGDDESAAPIGDLRPGESLDEREDRLVVSAMRASANEQQDVAPISAPRDRARVPASTTAERRLAGTVAPRGTILRQRTRLATTTFPGDDELRLFIAEHTQLDFAELVRTPPRGNPDNWSAGERARRDELARVVAIACSQGAGFEALARVIGRSTSTAHKLADHGQAPPPA